MENNRAKTTIMTLVLPTDGKKILLGMKKRGLGVGKWNGFGGKIHEHESIEDCARRETEEECGLQLTKIEQAGIIEFHITDTKEIIEGHVFRATEWQGELIESEEMRPQWFEYADIPYNEMWPNDSFWLPIFLSGKKFSAVFVMTSDGLIIEHSISERV